MRRFVLLLLAFAVVGCVLYVSVNRVDPSSVEAEQYRNLATEFEGGSFEALPAVKTVKVKPLHGSPIYYVKYFARLFVNRRVQGQAYYDAEKDTIFVVGDQACLEATLPEWMRPTFKHTLRHEYGHALLADWLEASGPTRNAEGKAYLAYTDTSDLSPSTCPVELRGVAEEYQSLPRDVYGQRYYMRTFNEYMAESYARFVGGAEVPSVTKEFLMRVAATSALEK